MRLNARGILVLLLLAAGVAAQAQPERTRLLLVLDCSSSMWGHWQSASKIKVTQQVLLSFLDSVSAQHEVDVALRVFGHLNRGQSGTRLEVPFGEGNTYRLQSKIKTLVPQGGCTAAAALTDALDDFPPAATGRNLILVITDGMDDCDAVICDVARRVQQSGVVVQTFVLGIGGGTFDHTGCAGPLFPVPREEQFAQTLYDIFSLSGRKARVVLRAVDGEGRLRETEHPVVFSDSRTGLVREATVYASDAFRAPDTLLLDPLATYDMTFFSRPPLRRAGLRFSADSVNRMDMALGEGLLRVAYGGARPQWQLPAVRAVVRHADGGGYVGAQPVDGDERYLAGLYDVEVQTVPVLTFRGVEVRDGAQASVEVPVPGLLVLAKPKGATAGSLFRLRDGQAEYAADLDPSLASERLLLQPGQYELVVKPAGSAAYGSVQTRRFIVESGQTTKLQF